MIMRTTLILILMLVLPAAFLSGCGTESDDSDAPSVVVTTSILGDVVANLAGDRASITVIMPVGADPHEFEPSARQVALMREADLIIANGLGLEEGLEDVLVAAADEGVEVLEIGSTVDVRTLGESGEADPHVWLDPVRVASAAGAIVEALERLDPTVDWEAGAAAYREELAALDGWIRDRLAGVPDAARILVTGHDALGYFADRYGFEVIATILPGSTTVVEPSGAGFAETVAILEASGSPAVFTDLGENQALAEQLADQLDREIAVVPLYTGSLGEAGSGAATYIEMMKWDAAAIARALEP